MWALDRLRILFSGLSSWYFIAPVAVILGVAIGLAVLLYALPGKPRIGVIDIPFTVITDDSAFVITEFLNYARDDDSIKAVVIQLSSPGGGAASSERLYFETSKLRAKKPVVLSMDGMVASGGYMMAMGANYSYAQSASLVGNVGVVAFAGSLIPRPVPEPIVVTGPYKLTGSSRSDWIALVDDLKLGFAGMVMRERGDRLRLTAEELTEGKLYSGVEAVRLGLADEIGGKSDAIEKAAELAGIANYGLVDVNAEVLRQFILRSRRIFASGYDGVPPNMNGASLLEAPVKDPRGGILGGSEGAQSAGSADFQEQMRRIMLANGLEGVSDYLPEDFPLEIGHPNIYYLYTGNDY